MERENVVEYKRNLQRFHVIKVDMRQEVRG